MVKVILRGKDENIKMEKKMTILNRNNLLLASFLEKDGYGYPQKSLFHLTSKFSEVTNGHYAVRVDLPKENEDDLPITDTLKPLKENSLDVVISKENIEQVTKSLPKKQSMPILNNAWIGDRTNKETIEIITTDLDKWNVVVARNQDYLFPNIDRPIEATEKQEIKATIGVNPHYLQLIASYAVKVGMTILELNIRDEKQAITFKGKTDKEQEVTILLMPKKL